MHKCRVSLELRKMQTWAQKWFQLDSFQLCHRRDTESPTQVKMVICDPTTTVIICSLGLISPQLILCNGKTSSSSLCLKHPSLHCTTAWWKRKIHFLEVITHSIWSAYTPQILLLSQGYVCSSVQSTGLWVSLPGQQKLCQVITETKLYLLCRQQLHSWIMVNCIKKFSGCKQVLELTYALTIPLVLLSAWEVSAKIHREKHYFFFTKENHHLFGF